jgi:hypothetical protein
VRAASSMTSKSAEYPTLVFSEPGKLMMRLPLPSSRGCYEL